MAVRARENPFRVDRTDALRFRFSKGTWSSQLGRLMELKFRAAIVGPQGSGKSTLLAELAEHFCAAGVKPVICRATADRDANAEMIARLTKSLFPSTVILLDSAEKLSRMAWWRLLWQTKKRVGLVVTVHRPCALPTWIRCDPSWELLRTLLNELDFRDDRDPIIAAAQCKYIVHRGNIREVFRELFDDVADGRLSGQGNSIASRRNRSSNFQIV